MEEPKVSAVLTAPPATDWKHLEETDRTFKEFLSRCRGNGSLPTSVEEVGLQEYDRKLQGVGNFYLRNTKETEGQVKKIDLQSPRQARAPMTPEEVDKHTKESERLFKQGAACHRNQMLDMAVELYTLALAAYPKGPLVSTIRSSRGHALYLLRRYEDAATDATTSLELRPNDAKNLILLGQSRMSQNAIEEAVSAFQAAVKIDTDTDTRTAAQKYLAQAEGLREAQVAQDLKKAVQKSPKRVVRSSDPPPPPKKPLHIAVEDIEADHRASEEMKTASSGTHKRRGSVKEMVGSIEDSTLLSDALQQCFPRHNRPESPQADSLPSKATSSRTARPWMVSHQRANSLSPGVTGPGHKHMTYSEGMALARRSREAIARERTSSLSPARADHSINVGGHTRTESKSPPPARPGQAAYERAMALRKNSGNFSLPTDAQPQEPTPVISPRPYIPKKRSSSFSGSSSDFRPGGENVSNLAKMFDNRERK